MVLGKALDLILEKNFDGSVWELCLWNVAKSQKEGLNNGSSENISNKGVKNIEVPINFQDYQLLELQCQQVIDRSKFPEHQTHLPPKSDPNLGFLKKNAFLRLDNKSSIQKKTVSKSNRSGLPSDKFFNFSPQKIPKSLNSSQIFEESEFINSQIPESLVSVFNKNKYSGADSFNAYYINHSKKVDTQLRKNFSSRGVCSLQGSPVRKGGGRSTYITKVNSNSSEVSASIHDFTKLNFWNHKNGFRVAGENNGDPTSVVGNSGCGSRSGLESNRDKSLVISNSFNLLCNGQGAQETYLRSLFENFKAEIIQFYSSKNLSRKKLKSNTCAGNFYNRDESNTDPSSEEMIFQDFKGKSIRFYFEHKTCGPECGHLYSFYKSFGMFCYNINNELLKSKKLDIGHAFRVSKGTSYSLLD